MSEPNTAERVHHPYSPSTLGALEACPCYIGKQSKTLHERTVAGTRAHAVAESGIDDARLSDEDAEAVADCLKLVNERRAALGDYVLELKEAYLPVDDCQHEDCKHTTAGYVDHVLLKMDTTHAELLDWKFGRWSVENAENNLQGIAYALGLFHKFHLLQTVTVWFKQPRISKLTSATFHRSDIPKLFLRVSTVVERARVARKANDFTAANPTVPNCLFCANVGICPAVTKFACHIGSKFHPLKIPSGLHPSDVMDAENTTLALELAKVMKIWGSDVEARVMDRVLRQEAVLPDGFIIALGTSKRKIVKSDIFKTVALKYLTKEEYDSILDVPTFGKLEELITAKAPRGEKSNVLQKFDQELLDTGAVVAGSEYPYLKPVNKAE